MEQLVRRLRQLPVIRRRGTDALGFLEKLEAMVRDEGVRGPVNLQLERDGGFAVTLSKGPCYYFAHDGKEPVCLPRDARIPGAMTLRTETIDCARQEGVLGL